MALHLLMQTSMKRAWLFSILAPLLASVALTTGTAVAQPSEPARGDEVGDDPTMYSCGKQRSKVAVSFKPDAQVKDLVTWAMGFTCKNFVFSAGVGTRSSKVTVIAPKQMSPRQAWDMFLVALQSVGLTVVQKGAVLEIVEVAQASKHPLRVHRKKVPGRQQMVRFIVRPQHIAASEAAKALEALRSKNGIVTNLADVGVVVVSDFGSHVRQMKQLLAEIDRPAPGESLYAVRVHHVDAVVIAEKLTELLDTSSTAAPQPRQATRRSKKQKQAGESASESRDRPAAPTRMVADERTNTLFVLGSEASYQRILSLLARLDVEMPGERDDSVYLFELQNADAEKLAGTMKALVSESNAARTESPRARSASGRGQSRGTAASAGPEGLDLSLEGDVRIAFDAPSNALLMIASVRDYLALRQIIRRLDSPRKQVYIEAVVLEVQADSGHDLGLAFHGGTIHKGNTLLGGFQQSDLSTIEPGFSLGGLIGGIFGPIDLGFLGTSVPSFGVMFQAMASRSTVEVLSTPHMLTANNELAKISAGENIPLKSGEISLASAVAGDSLLLPQSSQIERRDVALTLSITPHVNNAGIIRMEVDLEISNVKPDDGSAATLGTSYTKRTLQNVVMVRDQESVVLGGVISDRTLKSENKIPVLGDIPLLGHLFKSTSTSVSKSNLLVILTPYVIDDELDTRRILEKRMREREFLASIERLDSMGYEVEIDYRRKHGLVEEINRSVAQVERDAKRLQKLQREIAPPKDGPVEPSEPDDELDDGAPAISQADSAD